MSFIWPPMLLTMLLVPALLALYLRSLAKREQARRELGPLGVASSVSGLQVGWRRHIPPGIMMIGLLILSLGLARPEISLELPRAEGTLILAFDVSKSMSADDLEPTRIDAAKSAAKTLVDNQPPAIRIGVVAFGGGGLVVQQPTDDRDAVLAVIERLSPEGGTSLGEGIFTSLNAIAGEALTLEEVSLGADEKLHIDDYSSAVVLLLTDGENTELPDPLEVAQLAAEAGVRIYPVGVGSPEGTVLDIEGFYILTQLDEPMLRQIAGVTNGAYYHAENAESLSEIYRDIDLQLTVRGEKTEVTSIVAGLGAVTLLLGAGLSLLWFGRVP